jgi:putative transcriptional regulator
MSGAKRSPIDLPPIPTDEEIGRQVRQNPDAVPIMSEAEIRAALAREDALDRYGVVRLRRKLGLAQAQFAERFGIPVGTLRNWEQGIREPDAGSRVLLEVIARFPDVVADTVLRRRLPGRAA